MHIISFKKLKDYFSKETNSKVALQDWFKRAKKAEWNNFAEVKQTFNSTDYVGGERYVFDVKGNHYRIVAIIKYRWKRIYIRWIGNHRDYNKIKDIHKL